MPEGIFDEGVLTDPPPPRQWLYAAIAVATFGLWLLEAKLWP